METTVKTFVIDGGQHSATEIISRLEFISTVKPGEKINISSLSIHIDSFFSRLYRTMITREESRNTTYDFIGQTMGASFDLAVLYLQKPEEFNINIGKLIIAKITNAKKGIDSLIETYKEDRMFISRLRTLIDTINFKIIELQSNELHFTDLNVSPFKPSFHST